MKFTIGKVLAWPLTAFIALAGCTGATTGSGNETPAAVQEEATPVTLSFYIDVPLSEEEFRTFFADPVKQKYPHITLDMIKKEKGKMPQDLAVSGIVPDVILAATTTVSAWQRLDMVEDLNPYIQQAKLDMSRFNPVAADSLKMYSDTGETVALPYVINWTAMFYNKGIFDKLAIPYPKDGMDWAAAIELNRQLTRTIDGVPVRGVDPEAVDKMGFYFTLDYVDKSTGKSNLESPGFVKLMETAYAIYSVPGHQISGNYLNNFTQNKNVAAVITSANSLAPMLQKLQDEGSPMDWDMVSPPQTPEGMGTSSELDAHYMIMNKHSKHKQQTFEVMQLIVSDEVQETIARAGRLPSIKLTDAHKSVFASDLSSFKGKNLNAALGITPRENHYTTPYDKAGRDELKKAFTEMLNGKDVNTVLREASEKHNKYIESEMAK